MGWVDRLQGRLDRERQRYPERGRIYRVAWVTAAVIVTLAGIAMVVFPGPAFIVIPIGFAMLSLEFAWAQAVLDKGMEGGKAAADRVAQASTLEKVLVAVAVACGAAAVVATGLIVML